MGAEHNWGDLYGHYSGRLGRRNSPVDHYWSWEMMGKADHGSRFRDAHLHLLDRQVLDSAGVPVAVVDDLELSDVPIGQDLPPGKSPPVITALLSGPVLGTRIFGGRPPKS